MNYADLVKAAALRANHPAKQAREIIDAALAVTSETVNISEEVTLGALGKFVIKNKPARTARNPRTGAAVQVPAKTVAVFKIGKALKEAAA
jgi:DNA-binding protein HU-beta